MEESSIQQIRNDPNIEVAPSIELFMKNGNTFKQLQEIQDAVKEDEVNDFYNYVLKCTDGNMFEGKFLYINTTPEGELFGSGDPEGLDLTMYIESNELSEKHCEIKFVDNSKYMLKDCNSETGTWTRIGSPGESKERINDFASSSVSGIDLYQENRFRMYKAGQY